MVTLLEKEAINYRYRIAQLEAKYEKESLETSDKEVKKLKRDSIHTSPHARSFYQCCF